MILDIAQEKQSLDDLAHDGKKINPLYDFLFDAGLRAFSAYMTNERVLELGAGSCNFTQKLLAGAKRVDTVEGSAKICDRLQAKTLDRLTVINKLFEEFCPDRCYTDVVASFVNEHVADPAVIYNVARAALQECGHLFLIVPNREALSRQLALEMGLIPSLDALTPADLKNGHRRTYDLDSFTAEIQAHGFLIKEIGGLLLKPFADFQLEGWLQKGELERAHLEGLHKLARAYPRLTQALYAVAVPSASA